jgi:hypothetical protein
MGHSLFAPAGLELSPVRTGRHPSAGVWVPVAAGEALAQRLVELGEHRTGGSRDEKAFPCYDCFRCACGDFRGGGRYDGATDLCGSPTGIHLDRRVCGRQRRLWLGRREVGPDLEQHCVRPRYGRRPDIAVAEDRRRDRRCAGRLQLSVRHLGVGLGNRLPGLRPEGRFDLQHYPRRPRPHSSHGDDRSQA